MHSRGLASSSIADDERAARRARKKANEEERCGRRLKRVEEMGVKADRFLIDRTCACPRCGKREAHFAPPCFGEPGFFICEATWVR